MKSAKASFDLGDYPSVVSILSPLLSSSSKSDYPAMILLGVSSFRLNKVELAEEAYNRALFLDSNNLQGWMGKLELYRKHNQKLIKEPLTKVFKEMDRTKPKFMEIALEYAQMLIQEKQFIQAKQVIQDNMTNNQTEQVMTMLLHVCEQIQCQNLVEMIIEVVKNELSVEDSIAPVKSTGKQVAKTVTTKPESKLVENSAAKIKDLSSLRNRLSISLGVLFSETIEEKVIRLKEQSQSVKQINGDFWDVLKGIANRDLDREKLKVSIDLAFSKFSLSLDPLKQDSQEINVLYENLLEKSLSVQMRYINRLDMLCKLFPASDEMYLKYISFSSKYGDIEQVATMWDNIVYSPSKKNLSKLVFKYPFVGLLWGCLCAKSSVSINSLASFNSFYPSILATISISQRYIYNGLFKEGGDAIKGGLALLSTLNRKNHFEMHESLFLVLSALLSICGNLDNPQKFLSQISETNNKLWSKYILQLNIENSLKNKNLSDTEAYLNKLILIDNLEPSVLFYCKSTSVWVEAMKLVPQLCDFSISTYSLTPVLLHLHSVKNLDRLISEMDDIIKMDPFNSLHYYRRGLLYWCSGGIFRTSKKFAFSNWVEAIKCTQFVKDSADLFISPFVPSFAIASSLSMLGLYYISTNDRVQAMRCAKKSLDYNKFDFHAVCIMSSCLLLSSETNKIALCCDIFENAGWYARVGRLCQESGNFPKSIKFYQMALKIESSEIIWSELGESYYLSLKYDSALKCFARALTLCKPGHLYTSIVVRLARVKLILGHPRDVIELLQNVESNESYCIQAHAKVSIAKRESSTGCLHNARSLIQEALFLLKKCPPSTSFYKQLGDTFYSANLAAHLPFNSFQTKERINARFSYAKAIFCNPLSANIWYDMGLTYGSMHASKENNVRKSIICFVTSLRLSPDNAYTWDSLGTCLSLPLAIHCFCKSVLLDSKSPSVSRLAMITKDTKVIEYLQTIDSSNPGLWILLGSLSNGSEKFGARKRALELYPCFETRCMYAESCLDCALIPGSDVSVLTESAIATVSCLKTAESLNLLALASGKSSFLFNALEICDSEPMKKVLLQNISRFTGENIPDFIPVSESEFFASIICCLKVHEYEKALNFIDSFLHLCSNNHSRLTFEHARALIALKTTRKHDGLEWLQRQTNRNARLSILALFAADSSAVEKAIHSWRFSDTLLFYWASSLMEIKKGNINAAKNFMTKLFYSNPTICDIRYSSFMLQYSRKFRNLYLESSYSGDILRICSDKLHNVTDYKNASRLVIKSPNTLSLHLFAESLSSYSKSSSNPLHQNLSLQYFSLINNNSWKYSIEHKICITNNNEFDLNLLLI